MSKSSVTDDDKESLSQFKFNDDEYCFLYSCLELLKKILDFVSWACIEFRFEFLWYFGYLLYNFIIINHVMIANVSYELICIPLYLIDFVSYV